jgi:hypothetical protein
LPPARAISRRAAKPSGCAARLKQTVLNPYVTKPQRGPTVRKRFFAKDEFRYDPARDVFVCPLRSRCTTDRRRVSRLENVVPAQTEPFPHGLLDFCSMRGRAPVAKTLVFAAIGRPAGRRSRQTAFFRKKI